MTEIAIVGVTLASIGGAAVFVAVIDPSVTSIALAVIAAVVGIIPLWFKYRTDQMTERIKEHDAKIAEVIKTSDGMKYALEVATGKAERAEGVLAGVTQAEVKAALITAAEASGAAQEAASKAHKE